MNIINRRMKYFMALNHKLLFKLVLFSFLIIFCMNLLLNDYRRVIKRFKNFSQNITYELDLNSAQQNLTGYEFIKSDTDEWTEIKKNFQLLINYLNKSSDLCDEVPKGIKGKIKIKPYPKNFTAMTNDIDKYNFSINLETGGKWTPVKCKARHKVAVVIPYKNRLDNLNYFMYHMHPFLQKQELQYQIFVVEQTNDDLFNKGVLMNAAFLEIAKLYDFVNTVNYKFPFDCIIYHDVDLLPEDERILYSCPSKKPRHLSVAIDKYKYQMFYSKLIGGVLNFKIFHFIKVNGYSNLYWGWGGEDDDMEARLTNLKIGYERPNANIAHYKMLKHSRRIKNPKRRVLLKRANERFQKDGLNNVKYKLINIIKYRMFTHLLINVGSPPKDLMDAIKREAIIEVQKANKQVIIEPLKLLKNKLESNLTDGNND